MIPHDGSCFEYTGPELKDAVVRAAQKIEFLQLKHAKDIYETIWKEIT